jgi:hypothetical protein
VRGKLQANGWFQEGDGEMFSLSQSPSEFETLNLAQYYMDTVENFPQQEVEDPEIVDPLDQDVDP